MGFEGWVEHHVCSLDTNAWPMPGVADETARGILSVTGKGFAQ